MAKKFSKKEALEFGWRTVKNNIGFFIGISAIVGLIFVVPEIVAKFWKKEAPIASAIISFPFWILQVISVMGLIKISLKFCDGQKPEFKDLFLAYPLFFKYLFASILFGLIVSAGIILLILPGIIWAIQFSFFRYFIVDKELGAIESLKRSSAITKGSKWDLFIFTLLVGIINIFGAFVSFVGLFLTVPLTLVATAYIYRKLLIQEAIVQAPVNLPMEAKNQ